MQDREIDSAMRQALASDEMPNPMLLQEVKQRAKHSLPVPRGRGRAMRHLLIAALLLSLVASAAATVRMFRLQDLALSEPQQIVVETTDGAFQTVYATTITLQGFAGSREHSAALRWQEFWQQYTAENPLDTATAQDWVVSPVYQVYGAYSLEMAAQIREIAAMYDLRLLGAMLELETAAEFQQSIAKGPLFTCDSVWFMGYQFESGTFQFDGMYGDILFQLRASRKGVFDNTFLNIWDAGYAQEWAYETAFGFPVVLIQNEDRSLLLFEAETHFIVASIWAGAANVFDQAALERFADMIDFGQIR